ncbi:1-phosphofructokinase family hexose kinase [Microlunatus speluncae]|uniref:1-phosphofructokinase family hexose kinase n=1 Tax=Microlunatus speluncae TaxID=2594267 RepID=UPI00137584B6|nr:PfkB family carbohydrate kinase [Microlunatus speluncae]
MITVAGLSPSLDLTYLVDSLTAGSIHRPTEVVRCAGGKPLNLARAAAALGAEVEIIAVLGGTTGEDLAQQLRAAGVAVTTVPTPAETRTCVSIADAETGRLTELYPRAEPIPGDVWRLFHDQLEAALVRRPGWLAITGSIPLGLPPEALAELVRTARGAGVRVAVDTHGPALAAVIEERPELVKINRYEVAELLGTTPEGELITRAETVRQRTGGTVLITDGEHGSVAIDDHGRWRVPAPAERGRFPVGSGDSFLGGLLSVLDTSDDLVAAIRTATGAGTANALIPGPARFRADDVSRIAEQLTLEEC